MQRRRRDGTAKECFNLVEPASCGKKCNATAVMKSGFCRLHRVS